MSYWNWGTNRLRLPYVLDCGAGAMVAEGCSGGLDAGAVGSIVVGDGCETWVVCTGLVGSDDGAIDTIGTVSTEVGSLGAIEVACTLGPTSDEKGSLASIDAV